LLHSGLLNCFSYPDDVPPGTGNRNAAQSAQSGYLACFSYPADMPPGIRNPRTMPHSCSSYLAEVPRSMPFSCFSYSADVPQGGGNSDATQSDVPGLHRMPNTCFRY
jgi:hypothetical protein